jgi:hypothetical protein
VEWLKGLSRSRLTDVLVAQLMCEPNSLRLVLHRLSVNNSVFELLQDGFVDLITAGDV